jgi:DNA-binding MarR family transcriptional regulator
MNDREALIESVDIEDALAYRVSRAARVLRIQLTRLIARHGVEMSAEQYFVFFRAHAHEGCRQGELADPRLEDYSNVTRLIDSLVTKELLERRPDPSDRRSHLVFLTERGHRLAERLIPAVIRERRRLYEGISHRELVDCIRILDALEQNALHSSEALDFQTSGTLQERGDADYPWSSCVPTRV